MKIKQVSVLLGPIYQRNKHENATQSLKRAKSTIRYNGCLKPRHILEVSVLHTRKHVTLVRTIQNAYFPHAVYSFLSLTVRPCGFGWSAL